MKHHGLYMLKLFFLLLMMFCLSSSATAHEEESNYDAIFSSREETTFFNYMMHHICNFVDASIRCIYNNLFTITAALATSSRMYFIFKHRLDLNSKLNYFLLTSLAGSLAANLIGGIINAWYINKDSDLAKFKNINGLLLFDFSADLLPSEHVYHSLAKLHDAEIMKISIINTDAQFYAIVRYLWRGTVNIKKIKIFNIYDFRGIYFLETNCVTLLSDDQFDKVPVSIYSEDIVIHIFSNLFDVDSDNLTMTDIQGIDYSKSNEMVVRKLDHNNSSGIFSLCYRKIATVKIKEKNFSNSNETLLDESIALFHEEVSNYNFLSFGGEILLNQIATITFVVTSHILTHFTFRLDCPICISPLSIICATTCGSHWFCLLCLLQNIKAGNTRCPVCRM